MNLPAGGTVGLQRDADRRGFDGPIQLTVADLPKGIRVDGGTIPREYVDASNARTFNRRGILTLTADPGVTLRTARIANLGRGQAGRRHACCAAARAASAWSVDVAGATEQGVVDRQRPVTAPWLGAGPAGGDRGRAGGDARSAADATQADGRRRALRVRVQMDDRAASVTPPAQVGVDVIGAKDIRVIDMKAETGAMSGTFAVTTTKATDPARYDLYINGRVRTDDGDEAIVSRADSV